MHKLIFIVTTLLVINSSLFSQESDLQFTLMTGSFFSPADRVNEAIEGFSISAKHGTAIAFGGRLTNWFGSTTGLEASFNYTQSPMEGGDAISGQAIEGSLLFSALKFVFAPNEKRYIQFGIGLGLVSSAYDYVLEGDTHAAGVISLTFASPISDNLALYIGIEDYLHTVYWVINDFQTEEIFQNDLIIGIGLTIHN